MRPQAGAGAGGGAVAGGAAGAGGAQGMGEGGSDPAGTDAGAGAGGDSAFVSFGGQRPVGNPSFGETSSSGGADGGSPPSGGTTGSGGLVGWTCGPYYGIGDGCDCGCGLFDPDCFDATAASCDYCIDTGSCSDFFEEGPSCPGTIDPENNAVCVDPEPVACGNTPPTVCEPLVIDAAGGAGGALTIPPSGPVDYCDPGISGTAGASGAGGAGPALLLIDDFEDGDRWSYPVLGGLGHWMTYVSADYPEAYFYPEPCPTPTALDDGPPGSSYSMLTFGCQQYASAVLLRLRSGSPDCTAPVDASDYDGVRFKVRGDGYFRLIIVTSADAVDGTCQDSYCYASFGVDLDSHGFWTTYDVPFWALEQEYAEVPAVFDPASILELRWIMKSYEFEVAIDDVAFYRQ